MNIRISKYIGLFSAVLMYYIIHEGAHLIYALSVGVFRQARSVFKVQDTEGTEVCFSLWLWHQAYSSDLYNRHKCLRKRTIHVRRLR